MLNVTRRTTTIHRRTAVYTYSSTHTCINSLASLNNQGFGHKCSMSPPNFCQKTSSGKVVQVKCPGRHSITATPSHPNGADCAGNHFPL